ncbi:uncharacterized protein Tco025E_09180 [Trypanosoma conorhini]|uniref:Uncharacterized protein n=1 Tax=Trypanosoma conorhini TaxID=83891 RepID=A0A422MZN3_9TRYP|nr:uncharacterized protein Tco025E_09180 [Trypanosoma conorhini]RNE98669.1 hypothetical protein Tco025E_09180 [Trypanosoma conorhini]
MTRHKALELRWVPGDKPAAMEVRLMTHRAEEVRKAAYIRFRRTTAGQVKEGNKLEKAQPWRAHEWPPQTAASVVVVVVVVAAAVVVVVAAVVRLHSYQMDLAASKPVAVVDRSVAAEAHSSRLRDAVAAAEVSCRRVHPSRSSSSVR